MGGTEWSSDCGKARLILGDCLERLKDLPDCSVDSVVTDPPAGIAFMGKDWDKDKGGRDNWIAWMAEIAAECLRVLKPGGHALVWSIPRTSHWTATAWEDAGFQPRDRIAHCFGSGFPKSMDVSKQLDRIAGEERPRVPGGQGGKNAILGHRKSGEAISGEAISGEAISGEAKKWSGFGTALKPAIEDWWLLRKPLIGTVAENVLEYGTGAINVDGCRVPAEKATGWGGGGSALYEGGLSREGGDPRMTHAGRWPANLIHSGEPEVVELFPQTKSGNLTGQPRTENKIYGSASSTLGKPRYHQGDSGSAARFFYCAKASKADRDEGCEGLEYRTAGEMVDREEGSAGINNPRAGAGRTGGARNHHPTVKPVSLMRYLCRLITPPGGIVLDPFMGSGSTGKGAILEGFRFIGIEREADYFEIAKARIAYAIANYEPPEDKPEQLTLLPE